MYRSRWEAPCVLSRLTLARGTCHGDVETAPAVEISTLIP
jgi:hypothetical protein